MSPSKSIQSKVLILLLLFRLCKRRELLLNIDFARLAELSSCGCEEVVDERVLRDDGLNERSDEDEGSFSSEGKSDMLKSLFVRDMGADLGLESIVWDLFRDDGNR